MFNHSKKFKLSPVCIALLATTSLSLSAQEVDNNNIDVTAKNTDSKVESADKEIETIEVTGLRGSLRKNINDKRFATNVVDSINAEDVGKSTDQNVADALGRITGVTIVSQDGEGSQVTVRGASANQNKITINGQQMTSTDFSQAVDLSSFSADILSKLEVVKTPSANQDEGSLGASINLTTVRPLEVDRDVRAITLQGRYNDFAEKADYKISAAFSERFLDDTFGVAFSIYDETNTVRRDQYRVENFMASNEIGIARDQNGEIISGVKAIQHSSTNYELFQNTSDRIGGTLGLQWLPTDDLSFMFDATYSSQDKTSSMDAVKSRNGNQPNFIEGVSSLNNNTIDPFTDPQEDWYTIDTSTQTLTKFVNRYGSGDLARAEGGNDRENFSLNLDMDYQITEDLSLSVLVGHSKSTSHSMPNANTNMQNFVQSPASLSQDAGADNEPVGYDCTTSSRCEIVNGEGFVDLGEHEFDWTDEDGVYHVANEDNSSTTNFNPRDINAFHLNYIARNQVDVEDTISNAQFDFQYDVDFAGISGIEFGAKYTEREKFVDNQAFTYSSSAATDVVLDEDGNTVTVPGGTLSNIRGSMIASDGLDYDDFMGSLGYGRNSATSGWTPIDVFAAADLVFAGADVNETINNTETRGADFNTAAAYLKFNFSYFDGKLTGDIGARYVKTKVDTTGYSGANFYTSPADNLYREFDRVHLRELRDTSLPACQLSAFAGDAIQGYDKRYGRVDGLGWDTSSGQDPSGWTQTPDQGACHDPEYASWAADVQAGIPRADDAWSPSWDSMWRYADISTNKDYGWNSGVQWDGSPAEANNFTGYSFNSTEDKSLNSFASTGSHTYENLLPSLNLNYAFTDDFIGRFATSKTMTRPEIDMIRPGFSVNESGYWGSGNPQAGRVTMFNTQLEPLESTNFDISAEWYFNPSSLLSVALFYKDMKNFTTNDSAASYIVDLRDVDGEISSNDIIMTADNSDADGDNHGLTGCMPQRATADYGFWGSDPTMLSNDLRDLCGEYSVTKVVNGKGATIGGIELGYTQAYDFLPGYFLSGLGVSTNYTYQKSEYDADISSITGLELPTLPVAETPMHTYNFTGYWEQDGHQVRLSWRGASDSLVGTDYNNGQSGRTWNQGSIWNEGRDTLDFSATYQINDYVNVVFQASNLTDAAYRTYYTNRELAVTRVFADNAAGYDFVAVPEGNPLTGDATTDRTYTSYKVGTSYRLGVRVTF
ncbi:TonB-dependent receptor [Colwellia echini]|uniref:TonB-dependent receptor n=1 Tax=Colwellia echini TaxID=1982103 RepID=A0ABY3N1L8_9GAMM|nr:TonB-dependent receptor [Colwellia echini]TYK67224.1 TonB-dependent receptor [Colwellia echini]